MPATSCAAKQQQQKLSKSLCVCVWQGGWGRWRAFTSRYLIPERRGLLRPEEAEKRSPWIDFLRCTAPSFSFPRLRRSNWAGANPPTLPSRSLSCTHTLSLSLPPSHTCTRTKRSTRSRPTSPGLNLHMLEINYSEERPWGVQGLTQAF